MKGEASIHCGFYSDKGGFRISVEDRNYMESCKAVVSTCAFGGGDDLYQPIGMSESSLKKVTFLGLLMLKSGFQSLVYMMCDYTSIAK